MGLLGEITSLLGGGNLQRLANGQGDFGSPASPDHGMLQQLLSRAQPNQMQQAFAQSAQQMDPQQYTQHLSPAGGGALGNLQAPALATIATMLISHLTNTGGINPGNLTSLVPGLQTTNPNQMDANQVAALASYTQQNHPNVFGNVAAQLGQQQPALLNSFLGKAGLAIGAAALASHFIKMG